MSETANVLLLVGTVAFAFVGVYLAQKRAMRNGAPLHFSKIGGMFWILFVLALALGSQYLIRNFQQPERGQYFFVFIGSLVLASGLTEFVLRKLGFSVYKRPPNKSLNSTTPASQAPSDAPDRRAG